MGSTDGGEWTWALLDLPTGPTTEWNEVIGRPPPWNERVDPVEVCPSAVHLALQSADTLTGQVLRRIDFGKAWS